MIKPDEKFVQYIDKLPCKFGLATRIFMWPQTDGSLVDLYKARDYLDRLIYIEEKGNK